MSTKIGLLKIKHDVELLIAQIEEDYPRDRYSYTYEKARAFITEAEEILRKVESLISRYGNDL